MSESLKPCPFCGGVEIEIRPNRIGDYYAICYSSEPDEVACGASTSDRSCETPEGAIARWNRRDHLAKVEAERDAQAKRAEFWKHTLDSSIERNRDLTARLARSREAALARLGELEELLTIWSADGALQTFEDRERFRVAAQAALRPEHPPAQDGGGDV